MNPPAAKSPYAGYRFPAEVISHAVWLYFRFPLSLRMVEEMLAARGIVFRWDFLPPVKRLLCRALPDVSSIAPCSRCPGRCAPARSAGAAMRPPGQRLRAALRGRPVGTKGWPL